MSLLKVFFFTLVATIAGFAAVATQRADQGVRGAYAAFAASRSGSRA
jgi:hypothetical protein